MFKPTKKLLELLLAAFGTAFTQIPTSFVGLATAVNGTLGPNTSMGDFVEATGTGYVRQVLSPASWSSPFKSTDGNFVTQYLSELMFGPTALVTDWGTIVAYFITSDSTTATGDVFGAEVLAAPVALNNTDARLFVVPRVGLDPAGDYDAGSIKS